jgi:hypothetical protein
LRTVSCRSSLQRCCVSPSRIRSDVTLVSVATSTEVAVDGSSPMGPRPRGNSRGKLVRAGPDGKPAPDPANTTAKLLDEASIERLVVLSPAGRREHIEIAVGAHDDERLGRSKACSTHWIRSDLSRASSHGMAARRRRRIHHGPDRPLSQMRGSSGFARDRRIRGESASMDGSAGGDSIRLDGSCELI